MGAIYCVFPLFGGANYCVFPLFVGVIYCVFPQDDELVLKRVKYLKWRLFSIIKNYLCGQIEIFDLKILLSEKNEATN